MRTKPIILFLILIVMACVDAYDIKTSVYQDVLVVEGVVSNQLKRHQIVISRTTPLNKKIISHEPGATVYITNDEGTTINLTESSAGIYETPEFSAQAGHNYTLHILTADGIEYSSEAVAFTDGPGMENVYAQYIENPNGDGKGIQVFVDSEENTQKNYFYRWNYVETYEVRAPYPSNWVWTGGMNLEFRVHGIDTCFAWDTLRNILLLNTQNLNQSKITAAPIRYIDEKEHIFSHRYSILVQQFCLSPKAYQYWENLRKTSEEQGTLSDLQPGSLKGNMFSTSDPDLEVLGYFDVGKVDERRIFFSAITFYNEGLKMPQRFRNNCFEISPITIGIAELPSLMPKFLKTMNIWEVSGLAPATFITLYPITCTDCRDQGPTKRPDFF
jgi:hypothetical protein